MNDRGDPSLNEFTSAHYDPIYKFCLSRLNYMESDAYDVTNNVFLILCQKWKSVNKNHAEGWLYKTAKNKIHEYRRENYRHLSNIYDIDKYEDSIEVSYNMESCHSEEAIEKYKTELLKRLRPEENALFDCYYIQKKGYRELSGIYHINEGALRTRIARINRKIRNMIKLFIALCILLPNIFR